MISAKWSPRQGSDTIQSLLGKRSERIESASWYILISRAKRGRLPLTVRHVISKLCGQLRLRLRIILLWKRCLQKKALALGQISLLSFFRSHGVRSGANAIAPFPRETGMALDIQFETHIRPASDYQSHMRTRIRRDLRPRSSEARRESLCPLVKDQSWKSMTLKLEYLSGVSPECPLIPLKYFGQSEAKQRRTLVKSLTTGDRENVALHCESWIESVGGCSLSLRRGNRNLGIRQSQTLRFVCVLSSDGWSNVEGLLEQFCETRTTGFQELTNGGRVALLNSPSGKWQSLRKFSA